ncbi:MAG: hypothetical protein EAZ78_12820 [Oscillatoriales cyanobacterium]|uniref:Uncharacterized protein n=1 Tax=Microcoleus anatoxicus PTRS2 TaxID=2705321 RepID=A0ABU8YSQ2_9CYAN|nr:MAG: hypothetical protein EA000_25785 [Oscillatoriales cyanobacterium]TAE01322.1 MAG: hypothetical protein EAZ96_19345 [Oscillatoriales cyanobacterium]TAE02755.1 MAG: hypothetical protein EAZ98_01100 [Oscillatoriales cyanobacterium]TAF03291.1 MAG: hypothetical protein EAZ78_12820 [Oscillatoriales cyanobacterium]TAF43539.1 MAG: hypothetical protein EAZ68_07715 [Oscillatoriales cyanobacterium]
MAPQPSDSQYFRDCETQVEMELLATIVQTDVAYPWNPAQVESESYLMALEQEFAISDSFSDTDIAQKSQLLFSQLEQVWLTTTLQKSLRDNFVSFPQDLLASIAQSVQNATVKYQYLADQMVECVLDILPQWDEEDLQVLSRPLAYAMRDVEGEGGELGMVFSKPWAELSEIERAKYSLTVARYAISQLEVSD